MRHTSGYSLLEVIIVIAIIALVVASYPLTINFRQQTDKANDSRRKNDMALMKRILDDFYSDNNRYPTAEEICYNGGPGATSCNICGHRDTPSQISSYQKEIVCDPQFPREDYLYIVDDPDRPSWYIIYTKLSYTADPAIKDVHCITGCGPDYEYNYGISSDNVNVTTGTTEPPPNCSEVTGSLFAFDDGICNICGTYATCFGSHGRGPDFYMEAACTKPCVNP